MASNFCRALEMSMPTKLGSTEFGLCEACFWFRVEMYIHSPIRSRGDCELMSACMWHYDEYGITVLPLPHGRWEKVLRAMKKGVEERVRISGVNVA